MDVLLTVCTYSYRTHSMSQSPDLGSRESSSKMSYSRYWLFLPKAHQHIQSSSINISPQRLCMNYHVFSLYIHFAQCNLCHSFVVCDQLQLWSPVFVVFFSPSQPENKPLQKDYHHPSEVSPKIACISIRLLLGALLIDEFRKWNFCVISALNIIIQLENTMGLAAEPPQLKMTSC